MLVASAKDNYIHGVELASVRELRNIWQADKLKGRCSLNAPGLGVLFAGSWSWFGAAFPHCVLICPFRNGDACYLSPYVGITQSCFDFTGAYS